MSQHSSIVHVSIPIPAELARQYLDLGRVMPAEILPAMLREALQVEDPDPRERFSELDELIAEVVDQHGPVNAAEIARILDDQHAHITSDAGVRDRFRSSRPLRAAGYTSTKDGYSAPSGA